MRRMLTSVLAGLSSRWLSARRRRSGKPPRSCRTSRSVCLTRIGAITTDGMPRNVDRTGNTSRHGIVGTSRRAAARGGAARVLAVVITNVSSDGSAATAASYRAPYT